MAGSRAPRAPRRASLLRKDNQRGAKAVAPAESPRGRNAANFPVAPRKSQRVARRAVATIAEIGQGGGNPATPPPQIRRGRSRNGGNDAGEPPDAPDNAGAGVQTPVALHQKFPATSPRKRKIANLDTRKHAEGYDSDGLMPYVYDYNYETDGTASLSGSDDEDDERATGV